MKKEDMMGARAMQHPQDMNMQSKAAGGAGMAFLIGAAIGAVSGLLFAPKSGRETRDDLKHKADDMNTMAHKRIDQMRDKAHSWTDRMKNKTDEAADRADELEQQGKDAMEKIDSRARASTRNNDTKL